MPQLPWLNRLISAPLQIFLSPASLRLNTLIQGSSKTVIHGSQVAHQGYLSGLLDVLPQLYVLLSSQLLPGPQCACIGCAPYSPDSPPSLPLYASSQSLVRVLKLWPAKNRSIVPIKILVSFLI